MKQIFIFFTYVLFSINIFSMDFIEIHYKTQWDQSFIQYDADNKGWAKLPTPEEKNILKEKYNNSDDSNFETEKSKFYFNNLGIEGNLMKNSPYFEGYKTIRISARNLRFKFSNGKSDVDNNNGNTYYIAEPGRYILKNKTIQKLPDENIKIYYKSSTLPNYVYYKINNASIEEKTQIKKDVLYDEYYSAIIPFTNEINFSNNNKNEKYAIAKAGVYKISNANIELLSEKLASNDKTISIIQETDEDSYIYCDIDNMGWSKKIKLYSIKNNENFITIDNTENMKFILENKKGEKTKEYSVDSGIYKITMNKTIDKISEKSDFSTFGLKNDTISVFSLEKENKIFLKIKNIAIATYEANVEKENYYTLKLKETSTNRVDIFKDGILYKIIKLLKNNQENCMEASSISIPLGQVTFKFYSVKEENINMEENSQEDRYENNDVLLLSYGGWKECPNVTSIYQKDKQSYKETHYNMWLDFVVPNEYLGNLIKIKFINNSGPFTKEYLAYKNGKEEGLLKYSVNIPDVIINKGYDNGNSSYVYFKVYVGTKLLATYKYNLRETVEKNTVITTKEFFPYDLNYLGNNSENSNYLFEHNGLILKTDLANTFFYDGYYNKNSDYNNDLIKIESEISVIKLKLANQKDKKIFLNWTSDCKTSELYRSENPITGFTKIFNGAAKEFTDILPEENKKYYYRVQGNNNEGKVVYSNVVSASYEEKTQLEITLSKLNETYDSIELTWTMPETIKKYKVYRSVNGNEYVNIKDIAFYSNKFIDEDLDPQTKYSYMIKGITEKEQAVNSNTTDKKKYDMQKIYNFSMDYDMDLGLKISWAGSDNCSSYILEKTDKNNKEDINVKGTIYYDNDIKIGKNYIYKIFTLEN